MVNNIFTIIKLFTSIICNKIYRKNILVNKILAVNITFVINNLLTTSTKEKGYHDHF